MINRKLFAVLALALLAGCESTEPIEPTSTVGSFSSSPRIDTMRTVHFSVLAKCRAADPDGRVVACVWLRDDIYGEWRVAELSSDDVQLQRAWCDAPYRHGELVSDRQAYYVHGARDGEIYRFRVKLCSIYDDVLPPPCEKGIVRVACGQVGGKKQAESEEQNYKPETVIPQREQPPADALYPENGRAEL